MMMTNKTKRALELVDEIIIDCYDSIASGIELTSCRDLLGKLGNLKALLSEQEGREVDLEFDGPFGIKCPECSRAIARHSSPEQCSGCGTKLIWPNTDEQGEG